VVDAINTINGYTADNIRPPVDWGFNGHGPPGAKGDVPDLGHETCAAFVQANNGKYVPKFGKPGQPFVCSQNNPLPAVLDPSSIYFRPSTTGQGLPPTATVPTTDPATP
jgi:hypothetical protein